ncbi:MAG: hypothetical protein KF788_19655 [Piscinibacter sp.]|nr:hypothetical protein [Piscinibacter sp.]
MSRSSRDFKDTQVYDWSTEPKDERPSEFIPSTGFSSLSGYYAMPPDARVQRRRRGSSGGLWLLAVVGLAIGLGVAGLVGLVHLLKG